jgi:hypothetical protein
MTNLEQETQKAIAKFTVTKIHGQPTNQDIDHLDDELTAIVSSFPYKLGGGIHGYAGLVKNVADYKLFVLGMPFIVLANPGVYPLGNIPAAQCRQREAEHKALGAQFQTCLGASKGLKYLILRAVDKYFLLELQAKGIAYLNVTPLQMLTHLHDRWRTMDCVDITALLSKCNTPWNAVEVPTKYFNRTDMAQRQLARANIQIDEGQ